ncbi:hypothetical protein H4582DRAFT_1421894 [Lactarius indigo]|nr:hypothetical protein H4582DRAFT_1421894 [Lactarius indigo]
MSPGSHSSRRAPCSFVPSARSNPLSQYPFPLCFWAAIFISPPVLHTPSVPSRTSAISAAHTTHTQYYTYNTNQAHIHAPILPHLILLYHTQSIPSRFSCPISICALLFLFVPFLSLSFFLPFVLSLPLPLYNALCLSLCHLSLFSLLSLFVIRRLICARSLSFTLTLLSSLAITSAG